MKGYVKHGEIIQHEESEMLEPWEVQVIDAVGSLIEFWGFKRNQGRLWTLLYLRDESMTSVQLQTLLDLSKGSVSTITRDLEHWGVIHRLRISGKTSWYFRAETDLLKMVSHVIKEREAKVVSRVREDLEAAIETAEASGTVSGPRFERLKQLKILASLTENLLSVVLQASKWSMDGFQGALERVQKFQKWTQGH